jgi:hypothetical protein
MKTGLFHSGGQVGEIRTQGAGKASVGCAYIYPDFAPAVGEADFDFALRRRQAQLNVARRLRR